MTKPRSVTGRCECGAVRFTVTGKLRGVVDCHCGQLPAPPRKCRRLYQRGARRRHLRRAARPALVSLVGFRAARLSAANAAPACSGSATAVPTSRSPPAVSTRRRACAPSVTSSSPIAAIITRSPTGSSSSPTAAASDRVAAWAPDRRAQADRRRSRVLVSFRAGGRHSRRSGSDRRSLPRISCRLTVMTRPSSAMRIDLSSRSLR